MRVLHGESAAAIPVASTRGEKLTINPAAAAKVGLTIPASVQRRATIFEPATAPAKP